MQNLDGKYSITQGASKSSIVNTATGKPIPDDEPVFILRAKDSAVLETLGHYKSITRLMGASEEFLTHIEQIIIRFAEWEDDNNHLMKVPD